MGCFLITTMEENERRSLPFLLGRRVSVASRASDSNSFLQEEEKHCILRCFIEILDV